MTLKYVAKFTSPDGSTQSYTFPLAMYEWQVSQDVRNPIAPVVGADYGFRHLGRRPGSVGMMQHSIRCLAHSGDVDAEIADAIATCRRIGEGKLWTLADDGTERWQWASLSNVPDFTISAVRPGLAPLVFEFVGRSEWFADSETSVSETVTSQNQQWTVTNPGDLDVMGVTVRFKSNGSGGFTKPSILNQTNGHSITHDRTAADADSEVRIDTERHTAEWSTDAGGSYSDDIGNFEIGAEQVAWMRIEPGNNTLSYSDDGTPNVDVEVSFHAAYAH